MTISQLNDSTIAVTYFKNHPGMDNYLQSVFPTEPKVMPFSLKKYFTDYTNTTNGTPEGYDMRQVNLTLKDETEPEKAIEALEIFLGEKKRPSKQKTAPLNALDVRVDRKDYTVTVVVPLDEQPAFNILNSVFFPSGANMPKSLKEHFISYRMSSHLVSGSIESMSIILKMKEGVSDNEAIQAVHTYMDRKLGKSAGPHR